MGVRGSSYVNSYLISFKSSMNTVRSAFNTSKINFRSILTPSRVRRTTLAGVFLAFLAVSLTALDKPAVSLAACQKGKSMNIVAHADDDILFLSPDLLDTIDEGGCVRTVYVTAGNDDRSAAY